MWPGELPEVRTPGRLAQAWGGSGLGDTLSLGQSDGREDAEATGSSPARLHVLARQAGSGVMFDHGGARARASWPHGCPSSMGGRPLGWCWDRISRPGHSPGQSRRGSLRGQRGRADLQGGARARGN